MGTPPHLVLVVDDSPVARATVTQRLRALGLAVRLAEDGAGALAAAAAALAEGASLACAILDVELPDGDGASLAVALHRATGLSTVAFFTSAPEEPRALGAASLGPVFRKPEDLDAIAAWAFREVSAAR